MDDLTPAAPMPRRRRLRRWIVVAIVLGLIGGIGSELFLRAKYGLGDPPVIISDPTIEYRYAPNGHYVRRGNRIDINSYSMRSDDLPSTKASPAERRVLVLGDSVINGGAATDQAQLATAILQTRLGESLGTSTIVGNVSAGSWGPQNLLAYATRFGLFQSDVVVILLSSHDATDEIGRLPSSEAVASPTYAFAWEEVIDRLTGSSTAAVEPAVSVGRAEPCLAALDGLLARVREAGAVPIVLFHFERPELDQPTEPQGHTLLREVCAKNGIEPILLKSAFLASINAGRDPYRDHIHPNAVGQQVLADVLAPAVEAALQNAASKPATSPANRP